MTASTHRAQTFWVSSEALRMPNVLFLGKREQFDMLDHRFFVDRARLWRCSMRWWRYPGIVECIMQFGRVHHACIMQIAISASCYDAMMPYWKFCQWMPQQPLVTNKGRGPRTCSALWPRPKVVAPYVEPRAMLALNTKFQGVQLSVPIFGPKW